jgi:hypothetical protein
MARLAIDRRLVHGITCRTECAATRGKYDVIAQKSTGRSHYRLCSHQHLQAIQMDPKRRRLFGMVAFSATILFLLWYVDYWNAQAGGVELVGWSKFDAFGLDSIVYRIITINYVLPQNESVTNAIWVVTQTIPIYISWRAFQKLWGAV